MTCLLELGYNERIPNAQPDDKEQQRWISKGFYALPIHNVLRVVPAADDAYHFVDREHAANVQQGDERLKASRIVSVGG